MGSESEAPPHASLLGRLGALAIGRSLGLILLFAGLCQYESWSSRVVFGRWSHATAAVIGVVAIAALLSLGDSLAKARRGRRVEPGAGGNAAAAIANGSDSRIAFEIGMLCFGLAYLLAALADPLAGGRLFELDLLGSFHPPAILLGWVAGVAFSWAALSSGWRRVRERAPRAFLLLASTLFVFLLAEGVTRIVNVWLPATQGFPTASTELWMRRFGRLNSQGFRDGEHAVAKPAGTDRVLVIGDSFTFAMGVDRPEERVSDRIARGLAAGRERPVEILNAGVPYTHTLQHTETIERLLAYEPDVVVLLYVFNDIDYLRDSVRPSSALGTTGGPLARLHPMRLAFQNSFLVQQLYLRLRHVYWRFAPTGEQPISAYEDAALVDRHIEDLRAFVDVARSRGADVSIVPFNPDFASSEIDTRSRRAFLARAREQGLPVGPFEDVFRGAAYSELIVNSMDHHPSAEANRILAKALLPELEALLDRRRAANADVAHGDAAPLDARATAGPAPAGGASAVDASGGGR